MDPYPSLALMEALGATYPLLAEEEVIHEARRKRMRVGPSPPNLREMIHHPPPVTFAPDMLHQRNAQGRENYVGFLTQQPSTSGGGQSSSRVRSDLKDAIKELRAVVKRIRMLTRGEGFRSGDRGSVVEEKLGELLGAVSMELGGLNIDTGGISGGGGDIRTPRRTDDTLFGTPGGRMSEKRKRSRRIISLKKTCETMDIDMGPSSTDY